MIVCVHSVLYKNADSKILYSVCRTRAVCRCPFCIICLCRTPCTSVHAERRRYAKHGVVVEKSSSFSSVISVCCCCNWFFLHFFPVKTTNCVVNLLGDRDLIVGRKKRGKDADDTMTSMRRFSVYIIIIIQSAADGLNASPSRTNWHESEWWCAEREIYVIYVNI